MNNMENANINNLSVFCADIGSIKAKKFGWAAVLASEESISGSSIEELAARIADEISSNRKVAIGFECPLFVPVRSDAVRVNAAGEGNRSWSAGAGTGALATR